MHLIFYYLTLTRTLTEISRPNSLVSHSASLAKSASLSQSPSASASISSHLSGFFITFHRSFRGVTFLLLFKVLPPMYTLCTSSIFEIAPSLLALVKMAAISLDIKGCHDHAERIKCRYIDKGSKLKGRRKGKRKEEENHEQMLIYKQALVDSN